VEYDLKFKYMVKAGLMASNNSVLSGTDKVLKWAMTIFLHILSDSSFHESPYYSVLHNQYS
jgi:hypothetical protein